MFSDLPPSDTPTSRCVGGISDCTASRTARIEGSVSPTGPRQNLLDMAAVFRDNGHNNPKRDAERNVARLLRRQLRSYKKDDPKEEQQKALPVCILRLILSSKSTEICQAMGKLAGAAHFWAMRSCEYAKVPKAEQKQTKQLCIRNIAFIKDGESVDHKSLSLHLADCVSVTFERQKNNRKADTVTQWRTSDELLCPVKIWASLIRRINSYKGVGGNARANPDARFVR